MRPGVCTHKPMPKVHARHLKALNFSEISSDLRCKISTCHGFGPWAYNNPHEWVQV